MILAVLAQLDHLGSDHVLRAWVLGLVLTFGWSVGGLALLMVQYCSGGKWGLLLRRPLEAVTRTLPLVFGYWVVVRLFMQAASISGPYTTPSSIATAKLEARSRSDEALDHASTSSAPC